MQEPLLFYDVKKICGWEPGTVMFKTKTFQENFTIIIS